MYAGTCLIQPGAAGIYAADDASAGGHEACRGVVVGTIYMLQSFRKFFVTHLKVDGVAVNVDLDHVAVPHSGDGAAVPGFRGHVADARAPGGAGVAATGSW